MANTLLNPSVIAKEALMQLENLCVMGNNVHRAYKKEFVKVGDTVTIRKPVKFRVKDGEVVDSVDVLERSTSITISSRKHVAWKFSTEDLTLTIEQYSERYIRPAVIALANQIDYDGCMLYKDVHNFVGTPGTNPDSFAEVYPAAQRLDEEAVPDEDRKLVLAPKTAWSVAAGITNLYNPQMVRGAIERGKIGYYAGFDVLRDQNIIAHTVGTYSTVGQMNGTTSEGATSLVTDGWNAGATLKQGDVITIDGVYGVNPISGQAYDWLRQFTVTADATADGSGNMTINISPQIYSSAASETYLPYQTVDALPADNASINVVSGSSNTKYNQNLAFHKNAFALVMVPLEMPAGNDFKARVSKNGFSIRVIKYYDGDNDQEKIRLDVLYGWKTIYPDLAVRLTA